MGCIPEEISIYQFKNETYVEPIERMWNRMVWNFPTHENLKGSHDSLYVNTKGLTIWDHMCGTFVKVKRVIRKKNDSWLKITLTNGRIIIVSNDHLFENMNHIVMSAEDLNYADQIEIDTGFPFNSTNPYDTNKASILGAKAVVDNKTDAIPNDVFNWNQDAREEYLTEFLMNHAAGTPSKAVATQIMLLAQSVFKSAQLVEEKNVYKVFLHKDMATFGIVDKIESYHTMAKYAYGVKTDTEHYTISGVHSHEDE